MPTEVVTAVLRHEGRVLAVRRPATAPTYPGRWAGVSGYVEPGETPVEAARREVREETGLGVADPVAEGRPVAVADPEGDSTADSGTDADADPGVDADAGTGVDADAGAGEEAGAGAGEDGEGDWTVHPFLFDVGGRDLAPSREHAAREWVHAPELRRRRTVPALWRTYRRVAPTVRSVVADDEHGSAYLSVRALEILRDRAGGLAFGGGDGGTESGDAGGEAWPELADLAERLRTARPAMAAVANRVNRAMATAREEGGTAADVYRRAAAGVDRAVMADGLAAGELADAVRAAAGGDGDEGGDGEAEGGADGEAEGGAEGASVLTLSRSGTVRRALELAGPRSVHVAESRPGREGVAVAEALADRTDVTLHTDAAVAHVLATRSVDAVVVGADALTPAGGVLNKTGTRTVAVAAAHEDVPVYAGAATDKLARRTRTEAGPGTDVYDGPAPVTAYNPTFDRTPPELVAGVATERGLLAPAELSAVAEELAALADWRTDDDPDG